MGNRPPTSQELTVETERPKSLAICFSGMWFFAPPVAKRGRKAGADVAMEVRLLGHGENLRAVRSVRKKHLCVEFPQNFRQMRERPDRLLLEMRRAANRCSIEHSFTIRRSGATLRVTILLQFFCPALTRCRGQWRKICRMKTTSLVTGFFSSPGTSRRRLWVCLAVGVVAAAVIGSARHTSSKLVVHEWGTFTSVQGADGALMDWRPLETVDLPKFVYNWSHPGFDRSAAGKQTVGKGMMITLQRMETPVIYFYSDEELTAQVSVKFPQGMITEWYPQARQIGPASVKPPNFVTQLDAGAHRLGVKPEFTFASLLPQHAAKDSRIVWSGVRVLPAKQHSDIGGLMPLDKSGSHYFAARETDAEFVRVDSGSRTNPAPEHERFLFYRGVGSFGTPLAVTMNPDGDLTVTNKATDDLVHLFVLSVRDGKAQFVHLNRLDSNAATVVALPPNDYPQSDVASKIADEMAAALVSAGLFQREAVAMVNTWKDSWFAEEGLRVLYLLPRAWSDATLPLEIDPQPQGLVRVMVGRAEVITPELENRLRQQLTQARAGDAAARAQALAELRKLGRFAQPAVQRVTRNASDAQFNQFAWTLLQEASKREATSASASSGASLRLGEPNQSASDPPTRRVADTDASRRLAPLPSAL